MAEKTKRQADLEQARWWEEDADRLNKLTRIAKNRGVVTPTGEDVEPPELNEDGSAKG
jgi:hypothetical protein